jgi:hypothetical protein
LSPSFRPARSQPRGIPCVGVGLTTLLSIANAVVARRCPWSAHYPWNIRADPEPPGRLPPAPGSHRERPVVFSFWRTYRLLLESSHLTASGIGWASLSYFSAETVPPRTEVCSQPLPTIARQSFPTAIHSSIGIPFSAACSGGPFLVLRSSIRSKGPA